MGKSHKRELNLKNLVLLAQSIQDFIAFSQFNL